MDWLEAEIDRIVQSEQELLHGKYKAKVSIVMDEGNVGAE